MSWALKGVTADVCAAIEGLPDGVVPSADALGAWIEAKAAGGARVIGVDPISWMQKGPQSWEDDARFLFRAKRAVEASRASLLLVNHIRTLPHGSKGQLALDDMCGGAAYRRFAQCVLFFTAHEPRSGPVEEDAGVVEGDWTRTMYVAKSNFGAGQFAQFGFRFQPRNLTLEYAGRLRKHG